MDGLRDRGGRRDRRTSSRPSACGAAAADRCAASSTSATPRASSASRAGSVTQQMATGVGSRVAPRWVGGRRRRGPLRRRRRSGTFYDARNHAPQSAIVAAPRRRRRRAAPQADGRHRRRAPVALDDDAFLSELELALGGPHTPRAACRSTRSRRTCAKSASFDAPLTGVHHALSSSAKASISSMPSPACWPRATTATSSIASRPTTSPTAPAG